MKLTLSFLLSVVLFAANAQLSISGGYIRRTEGRQLDLSNHFGTTKPYSSLRLYNLYYLQSEYKTKSRVAFSIKIGGFPTRKIDYRYSISTVYGGGLDGIYHYNKTKTSTIQYFGMNLGLGVNFRISGSPKKQKKIKFATTLGLLLQLDGTFSYNESNHLTYIYEDHTPTPNNPNQSVIILQDTTSYAAFVSLTKKNLFSSVGISVSERFNYKENLFLELRLNFCLTSSTRLSGNESKSDNPNASTYDTFDSDYTEKTKLFSPILETGIGIGYIFPAKKKKST
jgi:hypothetical protein